MATGLFIISVILYFVWGWWGVIIPVAGIATFFIWLIIDGYNNPEEEKTTPGKQRKRDAWVKVKCVLHITYRDEDGNITERDIRIFSYKPSSRHIQARCSLRKANRTFFVNGILKAVDPQTGEILDVNNLHPWIMEHKSPP